MPLNPGTECVITSSMKYKSGREFYEVKCPYCKYINIVWKLETGDLKKIRECEHYDGMKGSGHMFVVMPTKIKKRKKKEKERTLFDKEAGDE